MMLLQIGVVVLVEDVIINYRLLIVMKPIVKLIVSHRIEGLTSGVRVVNLL